MTNNDYMRQLINKMKGPSSSTTAQQSKTIGSWNEVSKDLYRRSDEEWLLTYDGSTQDPSIALPGSTITLRMSRMQFQISRIKDENAHGLVVMLAYDPTGKVDPPVLTYTVNTRLDHQTINELIARKFKESGINRGNQNKITNVLINSENSRYAPQRKDVGTVTIEFENVEVANWCLSNLAEAS